MKLGFIVFTILWGCNPFLPDGNGLGQPCVTDSDCLSLLSCQDGYCESGKPDAGFDGGIDAGLDAGDTSDEPDCTQADCSVHGLANQGPDEDGDDWGRCCDT